MEDAAFADCLAWWNDRQVGANAWWVKAKDLLKYDAQGRLISVNLDITNPNGLEALEHREPEDLIGEIVRKEHRLLSLMTEIGSLVKSQP